MTRSRNILPPRHRWTPAEDAILRARYPDELSATLAAELGVSISQLYGRAYSLGLRKSAAFHASDLSGQFTGHHGAGTRFKPGHATWNKGTHYVAGGRSAETRFKPGNAPHTTRPVGSYRLDKSGNLQRKIGNARGNNSQRWRGVHELVWIEANGPVPDGHIVVFKKGMRTNRLEEITLDRIECITLAENMRRNSFRNYGPEVAHVVQLRGAITRQINKREGNKTA